MHVEDYFSAEVPPSCDYHTNARECATHLIGRYARFWVGGVFDPQHNEPWWDPNRVVASDLFFVASLSRAPLARRSILDTASPVFDNDFVASKSCGMRDCKKHFHCLLRLIPEYSSIFDAEASPNLDIANEMWNWISSESTLSKTKEFGAVTRSKLLARKRPYLVPILDEHTLDQNKEDNEGKNPKCHWCFMRERFQASDRLLADLLVTKSGARLPSWFAPLRIIDIVVWMRRQGVSCLSPDPWQPSELTG